MKSLWENALDTVNAEYLTEELEPNEIEMFCDGFCAGVYAAIAATNGLPEYKEAIEHIKWKMGIKNE